MSDEIYDMTIIGAGPGGYVAAIRAAQLGMRVAVIEKSAALGGVCLNEGCIPSKTLLDSSELFALARDKFANHGIDIEPPRLDLARMMVRKDDVVKKLTDGVAFLFKKNKITLFSGVARLAGKVGEN
ncbi:MAG TPA: FAD-dependent oxidoreductase, partial [Geobacteraceae bacterium]|nr:FAD-dependent oxidoreductase [Geobacteraceae bacterium]